jgi:hypothetical protein
VGLSKINSTSPFEQLPYELFMVISEHPRIACLVTLPSVSARARGLVQGLPEVLRVQQNIYAARALGRM